MKISFMGLGMMGRAMAERLIRAGHSLTVYNRSREKALPLEKLGAEVAATSAQAIEASPCSIIMVADADATRNLFRPEQGPSPRCVGRTIISMSTISPAQSLAFKKEVEDSGGSYLEAPVLGSIPEAESGRLVVLTGATAAQFAEWQEVLKVFSPAPMLCGPVGKATAFKLALNHFIAAESTAMAFSLGLVLRNGIDLDQFMDVLRQSALYAPQFDKKLSKMLARNFEHPTFTVKLLLKDVRLMIDEGRRQGLETAAIESMARILQGAVDAGWSDADYSALYNVVDPKDRQA